MEPILLAIFIVFLIVIFYRYMTETYGIFKAINIPGPDPMWVFGNLKDFKDKNPLDVFKEMRRKYGDIYGFFEGLRPSMVINDPEMHKMILTKHFDKFYDRPIYIPFIFKPDHINIFNTSGQQWKKHRTVLATAFNKISLQSAAEKINEVSRTFMQCVTKSNGENPRGFDISGLLDRFCLDSFMYSALDCHVGSLTDPDSIVYRYMMSFADTASTENPLVGLARVYPTLTPLMRMFFGKHKLIHEENLSKMKKLIADQRLKLKENPDDCDDIISKIMLGTYCQKDDMGKLCKKHLSEEEVLADVTSLIGGGAGTVNSVLNFVVHMLAVHQKVQQKVHEEIISKCGTQSDPDTDSLNQMTYFDMVISETLRLLPVAPGLARTCIEDCEINGVQFKEGMLIRMMTSTLYSDEKYFPEPEKFIPERFAPSTSKDRHQYSFLPYGQGPRMCIGVKYGMMMVKAVLTKLLQKYNITASSQTVHPLPTALRPMLVPKDGVHIQLIPRRLSNPVTAQG